MLIPQGRTNAERECATVQKKNTHVEHKFLGIKKADVRKFPLNHMYMIERQRK